MKKLLIVALSLTILSCTNHKETTRVLTNMGFTDIKTGGYAWFDCSKGDWYHTKFQAKNNQGQIVEGVVCSGLIFKSSTVRF